RSKRDWSSDVCSSDLVANACELKVSWIPMTETMIRCRNFGVNRPDQYPTTLFLVLTAIANPSPARRKIPHIVQSPMPKNPHNNAIQYSIVWTDVAAGLCCHV